MKLKCFYFNLKSKDRLNHQNKLRIFFRNANRFELIISEFINITTHSLAKVKK